MIRQVIWFAAGIRDAFYPVLLILLATAWIAPNSRLIHLLQGHSSIAKELSRSETRGYYESLLDAGEHLDRGPSPGPLLADDTHPPADWVPFCNAGLLEATPGYLLWRILPNLDVLWNGTTFRSNSLGYRTPEIALKKPAGVYRILVFGSSNTMGHGVDDAAVYPRLLEEWLNSRMGSTRRVEVVNLAVAGESPSRRLQRLREEAGRYQADWILCDASPLDHALEEDHLDAIVRSPSAIEIPFDYVRAALQRAKVAAADDPATFRRKLQTEHQALLNGAYAGWRAESDKLGIPLSVVILPRADRERQSPVITGLMRTLAQRHGLDILDLSDAFDGMGVEEFRVATWDRHPSVQGHRALFEALRDELTERDSLPTTASATLKIRSGRSSRLASLEAAVMGTCN